MCTQGLGKSSHLTQPQDCIFPISPATRLFLALWYLLCPQMDNFVPSGSPLSLSTRLPPILQAALGASFTSIY